VAPKKLALALVVFVQCRGETHVQAPTDVGVPDAAIVSPLDPPVLHVLLDDPRFADARSKANARDHVAAADAVRAVLIADEPTKCMQAYVEGRLRALAQDGPGAADAFDRAARPECPLASYASFRAAQAWGKQGKADEAIARAKTALAASEPIAFADDASLVLAEALDTKGDRAEALKLWRASISAHPKGPRWVDTSVRIAKALLDGVDGDAASHAKEALDAAMRVVIEAPLLAESSGANAERARALLLQPSAAKELGPSDLVKRAQVHLDGGRALEARKDAEAVMRGKPDAATSCKADTILAQTAAKLKLGAPEAWEIAIKACAAADPKSDALAAALFNGAKASWTAKKDPEALARFERVEKEFHDHRLADDARYLGALVHRDGGDAATFLAMAKSLPDDYPKGDMRTEALFRVGVYYILAGDLAAAQEALARAATLDVGNRHWSTAGRIGYFQARLAQQQGDLEKAKTGFASVIRENPMQFYMFQSYSRLQTIDAALAKKTVDDAMSAEPAGTMLSHEQEAMKKPAFARALRLLEVGEIDGAKKDMASAGAISDTAESELLYLVADLFDRAGAFDYGVGVSRSRITDHLAHAPSGRWRHAWEAAYPKAFEDAVKKAAADKGIPASLVWGVMREESGFVSDAKSPSGALGLMQLMPQTAKELARGTDMAYGEDDLKRPDLSIAYGIKLLSSLRAQYSTAKPLAIAAYNAGSGAVTRWVAGNPANFDLWVEQIPFEETRGYVKRVLASQGTYAFLYETAEEPDVLGLPEKVK
jgi:soluble lytic murein transglycosylase